MADSRSREFSATPTATSTLHEDENHDVMTCTTNGKGGVDNKPSEHGEKASPALDIEHVEVEDDPRKWSRKRKVSCYMPLSNVTLTKQFFYRILFWRILLLQV